MRTLAGVNVLYPSVQLERWMAALSLFMDNHISFNQTLKDLFLKLAHFVLTNNYVVGAPLPSSGLDTHVSRLIFLIWMKTPIV